MTFDACSSMISKYCDDKINIVVDNSHSIGIGNQFENICSFMSPRKFLPVTDGGILYTKRHINDEDYLHTIFDSSWERVQWLFKCIDQGSKNTSYPEYLIFRNKLQNLPYSQMSKTTKSILNTICLQEIIKHRNSLFEKLKCNLDVFVNFKSVKTPVHHAPLGFPIRVTDSKSAQRLLSQKGIYAMRYWPELENTIKKDDFEYMLLNKLLIIALQSAPNESQMQIIADLSGAQSS